MIFGDKNLFNICTSQIVLQVILTLAGILTERFKLDLITAAGQRRIYTELSPLPLVTAPY